MLVVNVSGVNCMISLKNVPIDHGILVKEIIQWDIEINPVEILVVP